MFLDHQRTKRSVWLTVFVELACHRFKFQLARVFRLFHFLAVEDENFAGFGGRGAFASVSQVLAVPTKKSADSLLELWPFYTVRHDLRPRDHGVAGTGRALRIWLTISMASRCAAAGPSIAVTFPVPRTMPVFGLIILKIQSYVRKGRVTSI